jgi:MOSC domain-containing protein YiiM
VRAAASVASVQVGAIAPLGPDGVPSGFIKRPVEGPVWVGRLNLAGDAQADLRVHGGEDKAVYAYAAGHYAPWRAEFPEHAHRLTPGAFGENLTIAGMVEADLRVGDVHAIGEARLQVCQPRTPCFKFALRFEDRRMPRAMVRNGRSGWYYRVLEEGALRAGDAIGVVERPNPTFLFERLVAIVHNDPATPEELEMMAKAPGVARWLRLAAQQRLGG